MIVVLSPAKTFTLDAAARGAASGSPRFAAAADALAAQLAKLPPSKLASLLGISAPLAALNAQRYISWGPKTQRVAAGLGMDGPAYISLGLRKSSDAQKASAAARVRILSGLYGVLTPFDAIEPYRLEMGTKLAGLPGAPAPTLYAHWGAQLAAALEEDAGGVIVNAASQEYWAAVAGKFKPSTRIIECKFPGPAVYAKAARGAIARFIADRELDTPDALREFTGLEGEWAFDEGASAGDTYVFKRVAGGGGVGRKGRVKSETKKAAPKAKKVRKM